MEMTSFGLLHRGLISIGRGIQQFLVTTCDASFDCLFSTRDNPYGLTLTARGETSGFLCFEVLDVYRIREYFGDIYGDLVAVRRAGGVSGEGLKAKDFLAQLNY